MQTKHSYQHRYLRRLSLWFRTWSFGVCARKKRNPNSALEKTCSVALSASITTAHLVNIIQAGISIHFATALFPNRTAWSVEYHIQSLHQCQPVQCDENLAYHRRHQATTGSGLQGAGRQSQVWYYRCDRSRGSCPCKQGFDDNGLCCLWSRRHTTTFRHKE